MDSLQIQCPKCQQLFSAGPEVMGKTVECGSCGQHFRVSAENIQTKNTRVYPGEKYKTGHRNFRSSGTIPEQPVSFQTVHYNNNPRIEDVLPMNPRRKTAIAIAFTILIISSLLFTIGASSISDITTNNRFLLAAIISLIAFALLIYGARRIKIAIFSGLVLIGVLCSSPLFFQHEAPPTRQQEGPIPSQLADIESVFKASALNKEDLGYGKVLEAMNEEGESKDSVIAYALYGYKDSDQDLLTRYLYEAFGQRDYPSFYKERYIENEEITLVVLRQVKLDSLSDAANIATPFGNIEKVHRDLRVIEVRVNPTKIQGDPESHYMSENNSNFFEANYRELSHIDHERRINALTRLSKTTSHQKRADFVEKLIEMLEDDQSDKDTGLIIQALNHWSFPEDNIQEEVFLAIEKLLASSGNIEINTMAYLIEQTVPGREQILSKVWAANPVQWQSAIVATGDLGRKAILLQFPELSAAQMISAASILRELGTSEDIPLMESSLETGDKNSRRVMKATIDEMLSQQ